MTSNSLNSTRGNEPTSTSKPLRPATNQPNSARPSSADARSGLSSVAAEALVESTGRSFVRQLASRLGAGPSESPLDLTPLDHPLLGIRHLSRPHLGRPHLGLPNLGFSRLGTSPLASRAARIVGRPIAIGLAAGRAPRLILAGTASMLGRAGRGAGASRWWKVAGLAGFVGVVATGVVIARAERRRRAYTPDEIRSRLHSRHAEAERAGIEPTSGPPATP